MSILEPPVKKTILASKSKHVEPKTSSILLISAAIFVGIFLITYAGIVLTGVTVSGHSECRDKIIGFEQKGMYGSPEQFKLALTYCALK